MGSSEASQCRLRETADGPGSFQHPVRGVYFFIYLLTHLSNRYAIYYQNIRTNVPITLIFSGRKVVDIQLKVTQHPTKKSGSRRHCNGGDMMECGCLNSNEDAGTL